MSENPLDLLAQALSLDEEVVGFREFVTGKDFCNNNDVYEKWLEEGTNVPETISELILDGTLGGGKCQRGDTRVLTTNGLRVLGNLVRHRKEGSVEKEIPLFLNNKKELTSHTYYSGARKTKKFTLSDGTELECSWHHPYKVWDGDKFIWKKAEELSAGDILRIDLSPIYTEKAEVSKINWHYVRRGQEHHESSLVDDDFGYFLGLMAGDGTYSSDVAFMSSDDQIIEWVKKYLNRTPVPDKRRNHLKVFRLQYMKELFKELGVYGQDSTTKRVPVCIEEANFSTQLAFVQGLMDTDGSVDKDGIVTIDLNSKELLRFVREVANALGIYSAFHKSRGKSHRITIQPTRKIKHLFTLSRKLNRIRDEYNTGYAKGYLGIKLPGLRRLLRKNIRDKGITFTREDRKRCSYLGSTNEITLGAWFECRQEFIKRGLCEGLELDNCAWASIVSIEEGECELFDLTNPESHSYRANGVESHNTTFSNYYIAYRVYLLFNRGEIHKTLGISQDTEVYVFYFSVSLTMAKKSGFKQLYNIFAKCKWFKENYPINTELKSSIEFPNGFHIDYASAEGHQIGLTVWGFILDEANFRNGVGLGNVEEYEEVTELYQQLYDRLLSRFARPDGSIDALAVLISSASYQSSFVEKRKLLVKDDPFTKIITAVAYEIKPWQYAKEKFTVFIGAGAVEPRIIENEEEKEAVLKLADVIGTGEEDKFFRQVPVNLKKSFQTNIYRAIQNHCGIPTIVQGKFMSNLKYLYESYVTEEVIPPVLQSFELMATMEDPTELYEYLIPENIQYPERPHSLFLDLSVQKDTGGLCLMRSDGKNDKGQDMHTRVFILKIKPPQYPNKTSIDKVFRFVAFLGQVFNIVAFASDQYQSEDLRQRVQVALGLENIRVSLDSSDVAYIHWMRALVDHRLKQIKDEKLEDEAQEAIHDLKHHRVIKSKKSSDDILQVEVGAFYLSDTIGKNENIDISDLYGKNINLVGSRSQMRMLRQLGYI